ncbi:DUF6220 domain-containing protein [Rhizomonospora bruguierae]|uniref:DUF6220 domain-containing protein n=1 Tax=Rhizomonospora bruguierae TaxID=1581705 RepID=UPI001BCA8E40|nr:DUF6220 domain-containing protein [Micromonospora sp. NBRC 107566]
MRKVYLGLCALLTIAMMAQMYFAAVGAFARPQRDDSYALHDVNGRMILPALILLAIVAAAVARAPGRQIGLTAAPLGLIVVQALIVLVGRAVGGDDDTTPVGLAILGLHAVNGMATMGVSGLVLRRARAFAAAPARPAPAPAPASAPVAG